MAEDKSLSFRHFKMVIPLMNQQGIEPTPRNYHVWYEYVAGQNKVLVHDIDDLINQGRPFTHELNDFLYRKFIGGDGDKKSIEEAGEQAKKLITEVARLIDALGNENNDYGKELDDFTSKLQTQIKGETLRPFIDSIVEKTKKIRAKGSNLNKQLETSNAQIKSLKRNLERIKIESVRDFLTGAYNRKAFDEQIEVLINDAKVQNTTLCLLMIDVDHFKKYNDNWGHQLGDEVLKIVSKTITDGLRGSDIIARYGGEEFAVLLPDTPLAGALIVADKLRQSVSSKVLRRKDTGEICGNVTVSMGVSSFYQKRDTTESFIRRADDALYMSKNGGRNKVTQESM